MISADSAAVHNVKEIRFNPILEEFDRDVLFSVIIPDDVFLYIKKTIDGQLFLGIAVRPTAELASTVRQVLCDCFSEHPFFQNLLLNGGHIRWINTKESDSIFVAFADRENGYIVLTTLSPIYGTLYRK